jgi:hypothetical protein
MQHRLGLLGVESLLLEFGAVDVTSNRLIPDLHEVRDQPLIIVTDSTFWASAALAGT